MKFDRLAFWGMIVFPIAYGANRLLSPRGFSLVDATVVFLWLALALLYLVRSRREG